MNLETLIKSSLCFFVECRDMVVKYQLVNIQEGSDQRFCMYVYVPLDDPECKNVDFKYTLSPNHIKKFISQSWKVNKKRWKTIK